VRLSGATVARLPQQVERFGYDRNAQAVGIVHVGVGAFHRAHQAWYTDRAMDGGDRNWAITGVSLRSRAAALQMNPQDGLYTVTERSAGGYSTRLVGAVRNVVPANRARLRVEGLIAAPATRVVSLTITEKAIAARPMARSISRWPMRTASSLSSPPACADGTMPAAGG
jgi:fructuronate reductase